MSTNPKLDDIPRLTIMYCAYHVFSLKNGHKIDVNGYHGLLRNRPRRDLDNIVCSQPWSSDRPCYSIVRNPGDVLLFVVSVIILPYQENLTASSNPRRDVMLIKW